MAQEDDTSNPTRLSQYLSSTYDSIRYWIVDVQDEFEQMHTLTRHGLTQAQFANISRSLYDDLERFEQNEDANVIEANHSIHLLSYAIRAYREINPSFTPEQIKIFSYIFLNNSLEYLFTASDSDSDISSNNSIDDEEIRNDIINKTTTLITEECTDICSICHEETPEARLVINTCNHSFHNTCIRSWFQIHLLCPICRYDLHSSLKSTTNSL
jgi:hypothetical protein